MEKVLVHLSDLHYRQGWIEEQGIVLDAFFEDLSKQRDNMRDADFYLIFSGDIVKSGDDTNNYSQFLSYFNDRLNQCDIQKSNRICVPGNHDVSTETIIHKQVDHEGVVSQKIDETDFNNYIFDQPNILTDKFPKFSEFVEEFVAYGLYGSTVTGAGWIIDDNIGIYCLNTALCSIGGLKHDDEVHPDKGRLAINTRDLQAWNQKTKNIPKILVMHHPLDWLIPWAKQELEIILHKDFNLCLSGHSHNQSTFHSINKIASLVQCSAPPLFTKKTGDLGYSFISISPEIGVTDITYRQWTPHYTFVTGVNFSNSDDGKVIIAEYKESIISRIFENRLKEALVSFARQPKIWVDPILAKCPEYLRKTQDAEKIEISDLVSKPRSAIIKAPPQFGLTCLSHYLIKEAWYGKESNFWLYLDSKYIKPNFHNVKSAVYKELNVFGLNIEDVKCVILDSWKDFKKLPLTLLQNIINLFGDTPIIIMQSTDDVDFMNESIQTFHNRDFENVYLWSLTRENVRKVVTDYNQETHIGDDDLVVSKVVSDLEVLNLHRTPLNCLTLLKVSELDFDESPVNRTEMLGRVLFLIFNTDIPTYKSKPDLKDCEYVLGYFCEIMLRREEYIFTRDYFLSVLEGFCKDRILDLDVDVLFDMLCSNNILVDYGNSFSFRFAYWIYYFAAHRMHDDKNFADFIFQSTRYANYPAMIEFYTGIDRRREDALNILIEDLKLCCNTIQRKIGLPPGFNPYRLAQWESSTKMLRQMQDEISDSVMDSKLPDSVKDRYADRHYQPERAYYQDVRNVLNEYSFVILMQAIRAASRALRNSDYVSPDVRRQLLDLIVEGWEQVSKVLIVLSPLLATEKTATFDGALISLWGNFGDTPEERFNRILSVLPNNVVSWFKDDLYSRKMGPLLIEKYNREEDDIRKHEILLLLIKQRPRNWKMQVQKYIEDFPRNSFYLLDVYLRLYAEYQYSFVSPNTLREIKYLIRLVAAKHIVGSTGEKARRKVPDKVLPERLVD